MRRRPRLVCSPAASAAEASTFARLRRYFASGLHWTDLVPGRFAAALWILHIYCSCKLTCSPGQPDRPEGLALLARLLLRARQAARPLPFSHQWTVLRHDGPDHLGLRCNALPWHQMALITSSCARQAARAGPSQAGLRVRAAVRARSRQTRLRPHVRHGRLARRSQGFACNAEIR